MYLAYYAASSMYWPPVFRSAHCMTVGTIYLCAFILHYSPAGRISSVIHQYISSCDSHNHQMFKIKFTHQHQYPLIIIIILDAMPPLMDSRSSLYHQHSMCHSDCKHQIPSCKWEECPCGRVCGACCESVGGVGWAVYWIWICGWGCAHEREVVRYSIIWKVLTQYGSLVYICQLLSTDTNSNC